MMKTMICGLAKFCGIFVLENGNGMGVYNHTYPSVHGLWPEVGQYGTSNCVIPAGDPNAVLPEVSCYTDNTFKKHEWADGHGICASNNATDFFNQVCNLSEKPLKIMTEMKYKKESISSVIQNLTESGYEVFNYDFETDQIELSVCAGSDQIWKFSKVSDFSKNCL